MSKNFLVVDRYMDAPGIAWRLFLEGRDVKYYTHTPENRKDYKGMVPTVQSLNDGLDDDTVVLFGMSGLGKIAQKLRDNGYPVIGAADEITDKIELDRVYAIEIMQKYGLPVPETFPFDNAKMAYDFLKKTSGRWVAKAIGESASDMTYVSKGEEDLLAELEGWNDDPKTKDVPLILQRFIEGDETNPEVWFSNGSPVLPANLLFETKSFMPGGVGGGVGCAASTLFPYYGNRLVDMTLKKLYPFIKELGLTGPADYACIIDKKGKAWYLESGWRFGYSSTYALACLLNIPLGDFFEGMATGKLKKMPYKQGYAGSLRVSLKPYPWESEDHKLMDKAFGSARGIKMPDVFLEDKEVFPIEVAYDGKEFLSTGVIGIVA